MPRQRRNKHASRRSNNSQVSLTRVTTESFQGPLPRPQDLERYEQILPGVAAKIFEMAERNQSHRQVLEKAALQNEIDSGSRGQKLGAMVAISGIVGGVLISIFGQVVVGAVISGGTISAVVGAFFAALYSRRKERQDRARWMSGRDE